ncbi:UNVERIFIED_CONTAM: putative pentatricopeptide repeat-containing protein, mitochondrial [Sesamum radiatum]|uniref:Pentatricopeptide repeat-containing protein, mitochondrial n=1 Tax=Sesamum radiatum TaxID=300843 RepID=A0AAW2UB69_SESRA
MSQKATACAIALFRRGIAPKFPGNLCAFVLPLFSSGFHGASHKDSPFSSKPRIDFSSINDVDDAVSLFRDMVRMRPQPSVVQFTKLLTVVVKMKHYSVPLSLFDKMRQLGAPVDEFAMSIAINCYCLLNQVDFGFAILGTFFKRGCEPDVTTFNTLIKGLFLVGEIAEAAKLFKKLLSEKLCAPNGLCIVGRWKDVKVLFNEMLDNKIFPDLWTFNILVDAICKEGMVEEAENVLEIMVQRNVCPDIVTYNVLMDGYCLRGQMDTGVTPNIIAYSIVIDGLCKGGKLDIARDLFNQLPSKGLQPNVTIHNIIIGSLCREGLAEDAKVLLSEMEKSGCAPDSVTYRVMIQGFLMRNELYNAMPSWRKCTKGGS